MPDPLRCQVFDYTCDDCMLPADHLDPPELNDLEPFKEPPQLTGAVLPF